MPVGSINQALLLVQPNVSVDSDFSYYFAPSMPLYAAGQQMHLRTTANGPFYTYAAGDYVNMGTGLNPTVASHAMARMDTVSGLFFTSQANFGADIVIFGVNLPLYDGPDSAYGTTYYPAFQNADLRYDIVFTPLGQADFEVTFAHEIMHSVGIRDIKNILTGDEDSARYTIMSYKPHPDEFGRFATDLQLYDIAALQSIHGRGDTYQLGDTAINQFSEAGGPHAGHDRIFSIWDAGGSDTIDASTLIPAALIDLRPGYFSSIGPDSNFAVTAGQNPSVTNPGRLNISIAYGAYIENAKGTSNGDLIIGNLLTNKLEGGAGADVIFGEDIDSIYDASNSLANYRRVTTTGTHWQDAPSSIKAFLDDETKQQDHLLGGAGDDHLRGGRGNDLIEGGADDDFIVGGAGNDEIWGGDRNNAQGTADGSDKVDYSSVNAGISITYSGTASTATLSVDDGQGGSDSLHSIEEVVGTSRRDYFSYQGDIPGGYVLIIDAGAGQTGSDIINTSGSTAEAGLTIMVPGLNGTSYLRSKDTHGQIELRNFHTQIVGSDYDDTITDEADGEKRIDGGDGDDVITVGGEAGNAMIRGGDGSDILTGGDGNDRIIGDDGGTNETNQMSGGEGADYIFSQSHLDSVDGGDGHDYLQVANGNTNLTMIRGGAGNDFIAAAGGMLLFGAADGNDAVSHGLSSGVIPINIFLEGMTTDDITLIWDVTLDNIGTFHGIGDMVLLVNSTGASVFIPQVGGYVLTDENTSEHVGQFWFGFSFELEPTLAWADVAVQIGGVSQYNHALEDYQEATAGDPEANDGTAGDDDLAGSPGDDSIDGGGGDDSFQGSGGNDTIDGGSGSDILNLFGVRGNFVITRNADTGDVTLEDATGLEGKLTIKSVEKIYFATDNEEFELGDLVGFWGTTGDDALVQGNARGNLIYGLAGNDLLRGLDGDDSLYGGEGEDTLEGGAGNDIYHVDHGSDTVTEAVAGGSDTIITNAGYTLGAGQEVETLRTYGSATAYAVDLMGNAFANTIVGNAAANAIDGKGGADAMWGYGGNDIFYIDSAGDTVIEAAGGGADTVISNVSYTLAAGQEIELLRTYGSATTAAINLTGNAFANTLAGNAAANVLDGKAGADAMWGHAGNDTYYVDNGADSAIEAVGGGSDTVIANVSYTLAADREIETLRTFGSATTNAVDFTGNELANTLVGNAAANVLDGKGGADAMWGYGGADTFAFSTALGGGNVDAIIDFASGTDTIALDDAIFAAVGAALDASEFRIGTAAADADDRIIYNSATGQLFYDADGAGGAAQVQFATLSGAPAIAAGDFAVI